MVNRVENLSIPLMGACIQVSFICPMKNSTPIILFQFNQTIFVSREGADSRSKAVNMIKERVRILQYVALIILSPQFMMKVLSPLPWPQFAVWPEGTCSNR